MMLSSVESCHSKWIIDSVWSAAWCHVTHAAVPVLYLSLYVELSPGLSQQSHHIHFAFLSCQVKSCPAILCTETQSAHPVQLYIVTLCDVQLYIVTLCDVQLYIVTLCDVQCVIIIVCTGSRAVMFLYIL